MLRRCRPPAVFNHPARVFKHPPAVCDPSPVIFNPPRIYFLTDNIVMPIHSKDDFQEPLIQKTVSLSTQKWTLDQLKSEKELLGKIGKQTAYEARRFLEDYKIYGKSSSLGNLVIYGARRWLEDLARLYLTEARWDEAEHAMSSAVILDSLFLPQSINTFRRQSNLGIISGFNRNLELCNRAPEPCVRWLIMNEPLKIGTFPYYYNFIAANSTQDNPLMDQAIQNLKIISSQLNNRFCNEMLDALPLLQGKNEAEKEVKYSVGKNRL